MPSGKRTKSVGKTQTHHMCFCKFLFFLLFPFPQKKIRKEEIAVKGKRIEKHKLLFLTVLWIQGEIELGDFVLFRYAIPIQYCMWCANSTKCVILCLASFVCENHMGSYWLICCRADYCQTKSSKKLICH